MNLAEDSRRTKSICHKFKLDSFLLGTIYSMEWSLGAEFWSGVIEWSGVRFWRGKSRMKCSCDVCVCV